MSRLTRYVLIGVAVIAILVASSFAAAAYTGRTSFCISCHEMQPYYESWQQSQHTEADCAECHIPKGTISFIKTKAFAFREVYVHVLGQVKAPLAVTREIPDSSCTQCHDSLPPARPANAASTAGGSSTIAFDHSQHSEPCVDCHVRFVHTTVTPPAYVDPSTMDACFACHDDSTAAETCASCHNAPHEAMGACDTCHGLENWAPSNFKHPFPLEFAHAKATCEDCHTAVTAADGTKTFDRPSPECASCHQAPHDDYGACDRCHTAQNWSPSGFNHPFPLEGGHAGLSCEQCHTKTTGSNGSTTFDKASPECVSCHGDEHGGLTDCARCHSPKGWTPANFSHPQVGEHIPGGEHRLSCGDCHTAGFGSATCGPCHNGVPSGD